MHMTKVLGCLLLVFLCCELCSTIKVPVAWDESANSEVKNIHNEEIPVDNEQQNLQATKQKPIPIEYFEYTAQKPNFATDIAAFHGVQNPQQHYKAYPVRPYTGKQKPAFGNHHLLDENKVIYKPFQNYVQQNAEINSFVNPTSTGYEIFHPYKAEVPALQEIYKDPVLSKIRNDLQDSKTRLQAYEQHAGKPDITKDEYLESPEKTDNKLFSHKNVPAPYEIHKPERRPIYYQSLPRDSHRTQVLNQKLKHPWNQQAKIRPLHYRPLHNHIHHLRQQHAVKYDDERNEYPQLHAAENVAEPQEGYDIYEKGKQKYAQLRNNLDESVNQIVQQNRPSTYQKLELQKNEPKNDEEDDEFVPVKNYAQVRKTETFKHVPKTAAFDDAETYEEILNAPRLREAVKSTKAQTVYSEEGYEDSAYDHAGEQKHASDQEGHGGFLKQHEISDGLYKIPTISGKYQDGKGSEYRDKTEHGKKWTNNNKDREEEAEAEDYSEIENEESIDADIYEKDGLDGGNRNKREGNSNTDQETDDNKDNEDEDSGSDDISFNGNDYNSKNYTVSTTQNSQEKETNKQHEVDKREANFQVPEINLNSTFSIISDLPKLDKQRMESEKEKEDFKYKYPYYFQNLKNIHKHSPLRYAENLKFIPKKSDGGTEFYDSRSKLECAEVDEEVDPQPEKLKNGENPTEENEDDAEDSKNKGQRSFETIKDQPRLRGLGDKIDCFKAKYFGENPLDSPFFNEDTIPNPEPIAVPKNPIYKLKSVKGENVQETNINNVIDATEKLRESAKSDIFVLLDKLRTDQNNLQRSLNTGNSEVINTLYTPQGALATNNTQQSNVYTDILKNIQNSPQGNANVTASLLNSKPESSNKTYNFFQNKEEVTKPAPKLRRKRATPFVYEPYKIIRDGQIQDSKKTTTTSNISPLIKQLQSSRVADRVSRSNKDDTQVKRKTNGRSYVDIGRKERVNPSRNGNSDTTFVDVSVDQRRGEPRYELRPTNHKSEYSPVENRRAMSVEAYKSHTTTENNKESATQNLSRGKQRFRATTSTVRPYYDVSQFIPKTADVQNVAASNAVKSTVTTIAPKITTEKQVKNKADSNEEESEDDYEDEDEDEEEDDTSTIATTTTTTPKPSFRRRVTTTTEKVPQHLSEPQRLKLVTRFRNFKPDENSETNGEAIEKPEVIITEEDDIAIPKYREKKKKSHTRTLVTDTKKYGDDDDNDMQKEEVDALIGVKHNMDDYMPMYEKEEKEKRRSREDEENDDDDDDSDDEDDDDDSDDEDEDENGHDDSDDDDDDDANDRDEEGKLELTPDVTTPEPTKRTLVRTTDAPLPTVATHIRSNTPTISSRIIKPDNKPIVTKKTIEIHKELPVNRSSPHISQFKQDIKEVEIIKEIPIATKRKPQKDVEVLDLYKDDNLAKDINKLGDVEIFRENLDLDKGPKHGGNYRQATKEDLKLLNLRETSNTLPKDTEASQSENTKHVELDDYASKRLHGGNLKSLSDIKRTRNSGRSSKLIELSDSPVRGMHGGNLKYDNRKRSGRKNERLVELDDDHDRDQSMRHDDDYKSHNARNERMHGGNYRSAKLTAPKENTDDVKVKTSDKKARNSAAGLLNSFAQAVPILTSTPGYILDPSKRMYYYVDA